MNDLGRAYYAWVYTLGLALVAWMVCAALAEMFAGLP